MPSASYRDDTTLGASVGNAGRGDALTKRLANHRPLVVDDAVPGGVAVLAAAHEHVLAVDALEGCRKARERGPCPLVQRVRLELDATAAEDVEGIVQLEKLGLRVRAGAPGRRCQPRPADLEAPVLGPQREEPGRADG